MELNKKYSFGKDSIQFDNLKFYISNIQIIQDEKELYSFEKKYHLIDLENLGSLEITTSKKTKNEFNAISFYLGIDSITNVSGAYGDDLDPTNGMYWTWQSGYINFKLEGTTAQCPARNNLFQFHIGGYQHPLNTLRKIELQTSDQNEVTIELPIDLLLNAIDLKETFEVMSPDKKAVEIVHAISTLFSISK